MLEKNRKDTAPDWSELLKITVIFPMLPRGTGHFTAVEETTKAVTLIPDPKLHENENISTKFPKSDP